MGFNSPFNSSGGSQILTDLEVDSPTVVVDETNDRVGIGTASPKTKLTVEGPVTLKEQSNADGDTAAYGQLWVKTATPNQLFFTTDAGDDIQLTSGTSTASTGDITEVVAGTLLDGGGGSGSVTLNVDLTESAAATIAAGDNVLFLDGGATGTQSKGSINDVATLFAGTAASTGLSASSGVMSVTDLHPVGVDGSANQLLTDDGDGTVTSESKLTFDGSTFLVNTDVTATTNHTTVGAHIDYDATGIIASGQTGQNVGLDVDINSDSPTMVGTVLNTGIDVDLTGGTSGAQTNIGLDIYASGADQNFGAIITGTTADLILGTAGNADLTVLSARDQTTGTTAGKNLSISAGSAVTGGSNNINGGDLILSTGKGDGTGTASMQFRTKVSGTDDVAERMRVHTNGFVGIGTAAPTNPLHISTDSDAEFVALKLGNESDANDTTGKVSLQFDLEDTSGNAVDAAKFLISKETAFTSTADTQDAKFELQLTQNGTLGTKFTVESDGDITVPGDVNMTDSSAINDENNNKLLKFCSVGSAVNFVEIENAADGTAPAISVLGDSTNITMSLKPKGTGGVRIFGSASAAASLLLNEDSDNGTNFMKFQAAANIASNHTYTFPAALPGADRVLQSDSSGQLSWVEASGTAADDVNLILHMQVFS